jgi:hypothetical protein
MSKRWQKDGRENHRLDVGLCLCWGRLAGQTEQSNQTPQNITILEGN